MEPSTWLTSGGSVSSRLHAESRVPSGEPPQPRLYRLAVPIKPGEPHDSEPQEMPTFRELLTQLSSEYERVENALADARAQLKAVDLQRSEEVGQGLAGVHVEPMEAGGQRLAESSAFSTSKLPALAPSQIGRAPIDSSVASKSEYRPPHQLTMESVQHTACGNKDSFSSDGDPPQSCDEAEEDAPMEGKRSSAKTQRASVRQSQRMRARVSYVSESLPWRRNSYWSGAMPNHRPAGSRWVINPEQSTALEKWDYITMVALAFVVFVTPVQVSMMDSKFDAMLFVNCFVDAIFLSDMILQFFLMYPQRTHYGSVQEHRHTKIVEHYLKTFFAVDVVSLVPFDLFAAWSNSDGAQRLKIIKVIRLLRLLKLVRVLKASRIFHRFQTRMSLRKLSLFKFFIILFGITHWLANLWALTLVLVDEGDGLPRWVDSLTDLEANVEVKTKDSPAKLYLACLYFTSYTITSVGYGDIGPKNFVERVVLTFIIIASGISWAVVLGQVCGIVANLTQEEQAFQSTMDELNNMMTDRLIPARMRSRLRSFFLMNKTARIRARHQQLMLTMSPGLRAEVSWQINRFWLEKVAFLRPFFEEAQEQEEAGPLRAFVFDTSLMMEQDVRAQGEGFGVPHTMYILNRGVVNRRSRVCNSGAVWGLDFVLSDLRLLEPVHSCALTYAELTSLSRQNFFEVVHKHSTNFPDIYRTVRRYCCWLAFQRAILLETKRRQAVLGKNTKAQMPS